MQGLIIIQAYVAFALGMKVTVASEVSMIEFNILVKITDYEKIKNISSSTF